MKSATSCGITFNQVATELLNQMKNKGGSVLEDARKLKTSMAIDGAHNRIVEAKAAEKFGEFSEMAKSTVLKHTTTAELNGKLKSMCMMKASFKSLASPSPQTDAILHDLGEGMQTPSLWLAEHRMMAVFIGLSSTKGSRRGVRKACQHAPLSGGFIVDVLPPAL